MATGIERVKPCRGGLLKVDLEKENYDAQDALNRDELREKGNSEGEHI